MAYTPIKRTFTITGTGATQWIALSPKPNDYPATISVEVALGTSASLTYSVEQAVDNPNFITSPSLVVHPRLVDETISKASTIDNPYLAVRINVTAFTAGSTATTITVNIIQVT